jgi:hypothetical protein
MRASVAHLQSTEKIELVQVKPDAAQGSKDIESNYVIMQAQE